MEIIHAPLFLFSRSRRRVQSLYHQPICRSLQRYAERPVLAELLREGIPRGKDQRNPAIYHAHVTYGYTLKEIVDHLGVHYTTVTTVSRVLNNKDRQI